MDPDLQAAFQASHRRGNSLGESRRRRGRWTRELDFTVEDARKEPVDVLWFVGDYASFDPRNQLITRTLARLLSHARIDFGILYEAEANAGNDVRRAGEEGLFLHLASENIDAISGCSFNASSPRIRTASTRCATSTRTSGGRGMSSTTPP